MQKSDPNPGTVPYQLQNINITKVTIFCFTFFMENYQKVSGTQKAFKKILVIINTIITS